MSTLRLLQFFILSFSIFLAGCVSTLNYNETYVGNPAPVGLGTLSGKAALLMRPGDDAFVFSGNPTRFTGAATSLSIPFGLVIKDVALKSLKNSFSDGADFISDIPEANDYTMIMEPKYGGFSYAYNSAKTLGFAITIQAELNLMVSFYDKEGSLLKQETYSTGLRDGETYAMSMQPAEKVNRLAHELTAELVARAIRDAETLK